MSGRPRTERETVTASEPPVEFEPTVATFEPIVVESPDGHTVTVEVPDEWQATATCAACPWDGNGWVTSLEHLAGMHARGEDGPRIDPDE